MNGQDSLLGIGAKSPAPLDIRILPFRLRAAFAIFFLLLPSANTLISPSPTSASLLNSSQADFNGDGMVNHTDLNFLARDYTSERPSFAFDLNGDGKVDAMDVYIFSKNWFLFGGFKMTSESFQDSKLMTRTKAHRIPGVLGIDLNPGNPRFEGSDSDVVSDPETAIDGQITVSVGQEFTALVRLNGASDLLGINFDFSFDKSRLEMLDIRETRMDIDYSGDQSVEERDAIQSFFNAFQPPMVANVDLFSYSFNDGTGFTVINPGFLLDPNRNGILDQSEFDTYVSEFQANETGSDIPFWTEVVAKRAGIHESIELTRTVQSINAVGGSDDNLTLLLRRPNVSQEGFGFDGDAILFEFRFRAIATGQATIAIDGALGILEGFDDIHSDVLPIEQLAPPALVQINPPGTSTPTLTETPVPLTPSPLPSNTNTETSVPSATRTPTPVSTDTPAPTDSPTLPPPPVPSDTETSLPTLTRTPTPSDSPTPRFTQTHSSSFTPTRSSIEIPTSTFTPTSDGRANLVDGPDAIGEGVINIYDLYAFIVDWKFFFPQSINSEALTGQPTMPTGDIDRDERIDVSDLLILIREMRRSR